MRRASQDGMAVRHRVVQNTLIIDLGASHRVLSSAPRGGGLITARSILNHQVVAAPFRQPGSSPGRHGRRATWSDPARYLGTVAVTLGARLPCVGLMTAVPMKRQRRRYVEEQVLPLRFIKVYELTPGVQKSRRA